MQSIALEGASTTSLRPSNNPGAYASSSLLTVTVAVIRRYLCSGKSGIVTSPQTHVLFIS